MSVFEIYKHPQEGIQAVKLGFSWPGFFLDVWWALAKRMWLVAICLLPVSIPVLIYKRGMFLEEPFFCLTLVLVYRLIIGFKGNSWVCRNLENRGYAAIGALNARDAKTAAAKVINSGGVIPAELKTIPQTPSLIFVPSSLQRIGAMVSLTWKAAFRYRLFWVIMSLLLVAVVFLPMLVKDDGTAAGFAQIVITYTLGAVTGLLGLCTLWLACGTLARDVEDCQIQMVVVKPISRWQIWLGKWLGIVLLDAALLALAGASIYGMLEVRARHLPPKELTKLQNEVLIARGSAREDSFDSFIRDETDRRMKEQQEKGKLQGLDVRTVEKQISDQVTAELQVVPPGGARVWRIRLGKSAVDELRDKPLFIRTKFVTGDPVTAGNTFVGDWYAGDPKEHPWHELMPSLASDTYHEFPIAPNLFDKNGDLFVAFRNLNDSPLLFTFSDGMEVLFQQGNFGTNFIRGLVLILCWMALLAAIGLASATFLSFPVAAFVAMGLLVMTFSTGTLSTVVKDGSITGWDSEKGRIGHSVLDYVAVPTFRAILDTIELAKQFSPIDSLSTGRSITWPELGRAVAQIVLLMSGLLGFVGIFIFNRRELARAQGTQ